MRAEELRVIEAPVTIRQINSILLRRPEFSPFSLSELQGQRFARIRPGTTEIMEYVTLPSDTPIAYSDLIGLTGITPYPSPRIDLLDSQTDLGEVPANSGTRRFTVNFRVDWLKEQWPESSATDNLSFLIDVQPFIFTENDGQPQPTGVTTLVSSTTPSQYGDIFTATYDYDTDGLDTSDLENTLRKYMYFEIRAQLTKLSPSGSDIPDEDFLSTNSSYNGSMTLTVFQLSDSDRPFIFLNQLVSDAPITTNPLDIVEAGPTEFSFYTSNLYKRTIDDSIAYRTPITIKLGDYYQFIPSTPSRTPVEWNTGIQWSAIQGIIRYTDEDGGYGGISGTFPIVTSGTTYEDSDVLVEVYPPVDASHRDLLNSNGSEFFITITPKTDAWSGYGIRASSSPKPKLYLSNPDQTVLGIDSRNEGIPISIPGRFSSFLTNNNLSGFKSIYINLQERDPEYILPRDNTVQINATTGTAGAIQFHTRWTGTASKTYYWRIETTSGTAASGFAANNGSFINSENLFAQLGDTSFNKNDIPIEPNSTPSDVFRLSVYTNATFATRVATTLFSVVSDPPEVKFTKMLVSSQYVINDPTLVSVTESMLFKYAGIANWYGIGQTLRWSYSVESDLPDSGDSTHELVDTANNPYFPDTFYNITTTDAPPTFFNQGTGDGVASTGFFEFPTLKPVDDSDGIGISGRSEVLTIKISDAIGTLLDEVTLRTSDLLQDGLQFTQNLGSISTSNIVKLSGTPFYENGASGTLGFDGKPYLFRNTAGNLTIVEETWQIQSGSSWQNVASKSAKWNFIDGTTQTGTITATASGNNYSIVYDDWVQAINGSFDDFYYRLAVSVENSELGRTDTYYSDVGLVRIREQLKTVKAGIIEGNLMYTPGAGNKILEGYSPVQLYMQLFNVPPGTEIQYQITDNANILPAGNGALPTTGIVTVPAGTSGLRNVVVDLPGIYPYLAHYTEAIPEYLQLNILDPGKEISSGAQYGDIGTTADPVFYSAYSTPTLSTSIADWNNNPSLWSASEVLGGNWTTSGDFITSPEDGTGALAINLSAQNVEPAAQSEQWYMAVTGDAAAYFSSYTDLGGGARGVAMSALDFNNSASTAQLKASGRYTSSGSMTIDGPDATVSSDAVGSVGIARISGSSLSFIWQKPLKIVNTVPLPWDAGLGSSQIAILPSPGSINEGQTVRFYIFDKARSSRPEYDDWNDATPIPFGTTFYYKVSGGLNFTLADFEDPGYEPGTQYGLLSIRSDGNAGPVDVTLTENDGYEDSEQFRLIVTNDLNLLSPSTAANSSWVTAVNTDPFPSALTWGSGATLAINSILTASNIGTTSISSTLQFNTDGTWQGAAQRSFSSANFSGTWITGSFDPADYSIAVTVTDTDDDGTFTTSGSSLSVAQGIELSFLAQAGRPGVTFRRFNVTISGPAGTATREVLMTCTVETR